MTINDIQDQIIKEFSGLHDWLDKYEYLITLGKSHYVSDEELKTDEHVISGCQSNVWLKTEIKNNKILFTADSDALITRGIISLLLRVLSNQTADDIIHADLYFIEKIGLASSLSPSRANGLAAIVKQIQTTADRMQSSKNSTKK